MIDGESNAEVDYGSDTDVDEVWITGDKNDLRPCPRCSKLIRNKSMKEHITSVHVKPYKCDDCGKKFGKITDLKRHKNSLHNDGSGGKTTLKLTTRYGVSSFRVEKGLSEKWLKGVEIQACPICSKEMKAKSINEHIRAVHEKNYKCDICLRKFGKITDMKRHKYLIHNMEYEEFSKIALERKLCPICGKVCKARSLRAHIAGVHEKNFECEVCLKRFGKSIDIKRHLSSIHGIGMVPKVNRGPKHGEMCPVCGKMVRNASIHVKHVHEKKFQCELCDRVFGYNIDLIRHHRSKHVNVEKTQCPLCFGYFRHVNIHLISCRKKMSGLDEEVAENIVQDAAATELAKEEDKN